MFRAKVIFLAIFASFFTTACSGGGGGGHSHSGPAPAKAALNTPPPGPSMPANYNPNLKDVSNVQGNTGNQPIETPVSDVQPNSNGTFLAGNNGSSPSGASNLDGPLTAERAPNPVEPGDPEDQAPDFRPLTRQRAPNPAEPPSYPQGTYTPPAPPQGPVITAPGGQNGAPPDAQVGNPTEAPIDQTGAQPPVDPSSQQPPANNLPPAPAVAPFIIHDAQVEPWIPGLYRDPVTDPAKMVLTRTERTPGVPYTDTKQDALMGYFVEKLDSESKRKDANEAFARQIEDASFVNNRNFVTAQVAVDEDPSPGARSTIIRLSGLIKGRTALLTSKADTKFYHYKAYFTCWDVNENSCQSSVLELIRYAKPQAAPAKSKNALLPLARSFVVHRIGDAFITTASDTNVYNSAHQAFNSYVQDSVRNSCLRQKALETKPDLKAAYERWCPGQKSAAKGAQRILLSSWAVARGRAQFYVVFQNDNDQTWTEPDAVIISGDAVISQQPSSLRGYQKNQPNSRFRNLLALDRNDGAELMADDGAGAFNIRLQFAGNPSEETRFSIISNFPETKIPDDKSASTSQAAATSTADARPQTFDPNAQ